jgi:hypothetical protein
MARCANYDKAKLQAVGIYRKATKTASLNHATPNAVERSSRLLDRHGNAAPPIGPRGAGDYRAPEGAKPCYAGKPQVPAYDRAMVRVVKYGKVTTNEGRNALIPDTRKRANSCPQERQTLTLSGCRGSVPAMRSVLTPDVYATVSRLIKR